MNAVLDFPQIHEEPPAVEKTNAIAAGIISVQGEVAKFDQIAAGLAAIEAAHPKDVIVADIATTAGMKLAEGAWRAYRNPRLEVERARKAAKAPVLALGKAIDAFAGGLEDRLRAGEDHYKAQIDNEEARREAVRAEAAAKEAQRKATHMSNIAKIGAYLTRCQAPGMTAERIAAGIAALEATTFGPEWEEFAVPAANEQCQTLDAMRTLHAQAMGREKEAARQELIRLENERVAKELSDERARIAEESAAIKRQHEAQQEELRRQADELAAKRAESERMEREAEARRKARQDAEEHAARQRERDAFIAANPPAPLTQTAAVPVPTPAPQPEPAPALLLQDESRGLSDALASKPDAMLHAREAAAAIEASTPQPTELQALAAEARASKFPSQPKMGLDWWIRFYALADAPVSIK